MVAVGAPSASRWDDRVAHAILDGHVDRADRGFGRAGGCDGDAVGVGRQVDDGDVGEVHAGEAIGGLAVDEDVDLQIGDTVDDDDLSGVIGGGNIDRLREYLQGAEVAVGHGAQHRYDGECCGRERDRELPLHIATPL